MFCHQVTYVHSHWVRVAGQEERDAKEDETNPCKLSGGSSVKAWSQDGFPREDFPEFSKLESRCACME